MEGLLELWRISFLPVNLPYTLLLMITLMYWTSVIIGALDISVLDIDVDMDVDADLDIDLDADVDVDADADTHAHAHAHAHGFLSPLLRFFFSVGVIPLTIVLSFLFVSMWTISVLGNSLLGNSTSWLLALALFVPNFIASVFAARIASTPFQAIFRRLGQNPEDMAHAVGSTCVIVTSEATESFGQAEVSTHGAPLLLNVRTTEGVTLSKGDKALIYDQDREKSVYLIRQLNWEG